MVLWLIVQRRHPVLRLLHVVLAARRWISHHLLLLLITNPFSIRHNHAGRRRHIVDLRKLLRLNLLHVEMLQHKKVLLGLVNLRLLLESILHRAVLVLKHANIFLPRRPVNVR